MSDNLKTRSLLKDLPIEKQENDLYDRDHFSEIIGDALLATPLGDSLCVAITGPWGSGKTSVINLVKNYISSKRDTLEPKTSVIPFEPWNFTTSEQLLTQFFLQLAEFFGVDKKEKDSIGQCIIDYASKLELSFALSAMSNAKPEAKIGVNLLKSTAVYLGNLLKKTAFTNKSIQTQKNEVDKLLKSSKEKVIVIIDDIDRLADDQIRCIFQLVTIICKFPNISYLLSFDRKVVAKALDKYQHEKGNEFLDKVIQVPLCIPRLNSNKLNTTLSYHLNELIKIYNIEYIDKEKWDSLYLYCAKQLITTHRDVVRLSNEMETKLRLLSNETDFIDLLTLTIIEQHEPQMYAWIEQHEHLLTGQITYESIHDRGTEDKDKANRKEKYKDELTNLLLHKDKFTVDLAIDVLCILFPQFSASIGGHYPAYDDDTARKNNNICHPVKFDRYYSYTIDRDQITYNDLMFILNNATSDEIKKYTLAKDSQGNSIELFNELSLHLNTISKQRIKLLVDGICQIGDQLKSSANNGLFNVAATDKAIHLIYKMLFLLDENSRYTLMKDIVHNMDINNLNTVSGLVLGIYKARNNNNGSKDEQSGKYPSLSEKNYLMLEKLYLTRIKSITQVINIQQLLDKNYFVSFYKKFQEGIDYLKTSILSDPISIIKYVSQKVDHWTSLGSLKEIGITDAYKELVTEEQVENAIQEILTTGKYKNLDHDQQRIIAAFTMRKDVYYADWKSIDVNEIDKRVAELLSEYS